MDDPRRAFRLDRTRILKFLKWTSDRSFDLFKSMDFVTIFLLLSSFFSVSSVGQFDGY